MSPVHCKGPGREGAAGSTPCLSPVPTWSLHIRTGARRGPGHPGEHRARARRPPTFTVAVAQVPAVGIVGVVEAVVERQPRDAGQGVQQDQQQRAHGARHGCSARVSGVRWEPGAGWQEKKNKPVREACCRGPEGPWVPAPTHSLNRSLHSIFCTAPPPPAGPDLTAEETEGSEPRSCPLGNRIPQARWARSEPTKPREELGEGTTSSEKITQGEKAVSSFQMARLDLKDCEQHFLNDTEEPRLD